MKSNIITSFLLGLCALTAAVPVSAQKQIPATKLGALVYGSSEIKLPDNEATEMVLPSYSRYKFVVSDDYWVHPSVRNGVIYLSIDQNSTASTRTATLALRSAAGATTNITVEQPGWNLTDDAEAAYADRFITPVRCVDAATSYQGRANSSSEDISKTIDGDMTTIYHSSYYGFSTSVTGQRPVLEYYFTPQGDLNNGVELESMTYIPRQDGENGHFGLIVVEIARKSGNKMQWTAISSNPIDLKMSGQPSVIPFPDNLQTGILGVRVTVHTGLSGKSGSNFASCAEMKFNKKSLANPATDMFVDGVCSQLKPGVTLAQINAMTDPFYKKLARLIYDGQYDPTNMVSTHNAVMSPQTLAESWNAPGKCYDQSQGVTGVVLNPGRYVVLASDIPADKGSVGMVVIRWHGHEQFDDANGNSQKWYAERFNFNLVNGINIIDIPTPKREDAKIVKGHDQGLAYINNFDDRVTSPEEGAARAVKVHIIGALHNGYLSNLKTNAENQTVLNNAIYPVVDCLGTRVHSVWQVNALKSYASGQYVRYINLLDQIAIWEHRVLGLDKYNRVPENRTMTYVNYDYYMYQGGWGPTFMYDTQWRVCNPTRLMTADSDAIWGLSHEWGHQHQMAPYFRWIGTAEVTNNIFSAYNVIHMGYNVRTNRERYHYDNWHDYNGRTARIRRIFVNDDYNRDITDPKDGETKTANDGDNIVMSLRTDAAKAAKAGNAFWWCNELKQFALDQVKYPTKRLASSKTYSGAPTDTWNTANTSDPRNIVDPRRALNAIEAYSSNNGELILAPFLYLMYYFSDTNPDRDPADYRPDLWPDLFESMRQNDLDNGSSIEPGKTTPDKYEILTSIFNGNRSASGINKVSQFKKLFPESCWTKRGYIGGENDKIAWTANSAPAILNCIRKLSRLTGYNLWSYFEPFGLFTVCALEQGDYGIQYYIMTDAMYDEFKADMYQLETDGIVKPLPEKIRQAITTIDAPVYPAPTIPNDRPITANDN
ncbi:MAG: M60 family metallopeptidase [Muribaculaceae bacterium]|nr:M60 family metallopeptidase [Muribaculaceae bacterium]